MTSSIVIVTGAAGNLGRAVVACLAAAGSTIVAVDRETGPLTQMLAATPGQGHLAVAGVDLSDAQACADMVQTTLDKVGFIDGVVHTVGGFAMGSLQETNAAQFEAMFRLNTVTTMNVFQAVAPTMRARSRGCMIAMGAGPGLRAPAGLSAYASSKAAVHRIVESLADEMKADGVRVNAVLPSIIDTPQNRSSMPDADHAAWVSPKNLAATIAFLLSDAGADITGALIPVTGRV